MHSIRLEGPALAFAPAAIMATCSAAAKTEIKLGNTVPCSGPASFHGLASQATMTHNLCRKIQLLRFDGRRWVPLGKPVGE